MDKLIYIAVLFFGGGVGFWLGAQSSAEDPSGAAQERAARVAVTDSEIPNGRLKALEARLDHLAARMERRRTRRATAIPAAAVARSASEKPARRAEAEALAKGGALTKGGALAKPEALGSWVADALNEPDSPLREGLVDIVRNELETVREERGEVRRAWHEARDEERLEKFSDEADLTQSQKSSLDEVLTEERERVRALYQTARENYNFREARSKHQEVKEESDEKIRELLDDEQFQEWETMRAERRRGH